MTKSKLKNRQLIYVVLRVAEGTGQSVVLDSFATLEACENKCGEHSQLFKDKNVEGYIFQAVTSFFYDE
jgi:hypothetical protein